MHLKIIFFIIRKAGRISNLSKVATQWLWTTKWSCSYLLIIKNVTDGSKKIFYNSKNILISCTLTPLCSTRSDFRRNCPDTDTCTQQQRQRTPVTSFPHWRQWDHCWWSVLGRRLRRSCRDSPILSCRSLRRWRRPGLGSRDGKGRRNLEREDLFLGRLVCRYFLT